VLLTIRIVGLRGSSEEMVGLCARFLMKQLGEKIPKDVGKRILQRIIDKGGLMGSAAKMYIGDEEKTMQFITECAGQCHNKLAHDIWGEELVFEILKYSNALIKDLHECKI